MYLLIHILLLLFHPLCLFRRVTARNANLLPVRLKEFDGVSGKVVQQNLLAPVAAHDVVAKMYSPCSELLNQGGKAMNLDLDTIPVFERSHAALNFLLPPPRRWAQAVQPNTIRFLQHLMDQLGDLLLRFLQGQALLWGNHVVRAHAPFDHTILTQQIALLLQAV